MGNLVFGKGCEINKIIPTEVLKKIMANLDYKSLCHARRTCKYWKEILDEFDLVEPALSKFFFE